MSNANEEYPRCNGSAFPPVLDACCGSRMMWFDKSDGRALFVDCRNETHVQKSKRWNDRNIVVAPDIQADFTDLPFPTDTFDHVVFDPPHMEKIGQSSTVAKTYGKLICDWRDMLRNGFAECFRVLRPGGTLIFKWCEFEIPLAEVLVLTPERPLYGTKYGKRERSHWIAFLKPNAESEASE